MFLLRYFYDDVICTLRMGECVYVCTSVTYTYFFMKRKSNYEQDTTHKKEDMHILVEWRKHPCTDIVWRCWSYDHVMMEGVLFYFIFYENKIEGCWTNYKGLDHHKTEGAHALARRLVVVSGWSTLALTSTW
jgi:hypothetical protein